MEKEPAEQQGTIKEFALKWQVDYLEANGLIKYLERKGKVSIIGKQKMGKGQPSKIYSVPSNILLTL